MSNWRRDTQVDAGSDEMPALPMWMSDVPFCDDQCPHYDGKRCRVLGFKPDRICEPVVQQMAKMLTKAAP